MDERVSLEATTKQLDRVLGFFSRVEAKASFIFAMNTGLLGIMALNFEPGDLQVWYLIIPACVALALLLASILFAYRCSFPHLDGGAASLIYFREIVKKTESNFIGAFLNQTVDDHIRDMLSQIWRNSEILKLKFERLKTAFICTAIAIVPWAIFLATSSFYHAGGILIK